MARLLRRPRTGSCAPRRRQTTAGRFILLLSTLAMIAGACSGSDDDTAGDTEQLDELLSDAAAAMGEVTSVHFEIQHSGAAVHLDPEDNLGFEAATGDFAAPDSAQAVMDVLIGGELRTRIGAVAIGDDAWLQTPLTGWSTLPESYGLDPGGFFDPKGGWQPLIEQLEQPELVGTDDQGVHVRATGPGDRIEVVTAGLVDEDVSLDLWFDPDTSLVRRLEFTVETSAGDAEWLITLDRFGEPVTIEPPV